MKIREDNAGRAYSCSCGGIEFTGDQAADADGKPFTTLSEWAGEADEEAYRDL